MCGFEYFISEHGLPLWKKKKLQKMGSWCVSWRNGFFLNTSHYYKTLKVFLCIDDNSWKGQGDILNSNILRDFKAMCSCYKKFVVYCRLLELCLIKVEKDLSPYSTILLLRSEGFWTDTFLSLSQFGVGSSKQVLHSPQHNIEL